MRYSIEPRDLKRYRFLSFAKNIVTHPTKIAKHMNNRYSQKLFDSATKFTTDPVKTASKRAFQKEAEAIGDLIGNKIADGITNLSKEPSKWLHSQNENELEIPKERYMSPEKRQQIIDELRLV